MTKKILKIKNKICLKIIELIDQSKFLGLAIKAAKEVS